MKSYDFETVTPRYDIGAPKWLAIKNAFPDPKDRENIIPFSVADMELELAPEIRDGLKSFLDHYPVGYGKPTPEYLGAVCGWMKKRHNWDIKPEWIVCTRGVVNAFHECVRTYAQEGQGVIMMTPIYYPMYNAIRRNNRVLAECPLIDRGTGYEIDFNLLEELASKPENTMLLFCSPHNPGGRVWTREELEKIAEICIRNHVVICSDEIHFDLIMPGYQHTVFASLSEEVAQNCVIMTAPSKTFSLAGLETSNIIIPNEQLRKMFVTDVEKTFMDARCCLLGFEACRIAYTECGEWLDQVIELIHHNEMIVLDFLKKEFPEVTCHRMEGTYLLWMNFKSLNLDPKVLADRMRMGAKMFMDDGFVFGKSGEGYERWNLACPTKYVEEALERLKKEFK